MIVALCACNYIHLAIMNVALCACMAACDSVAGPLLQDSQIDRIMATLVGSRTPGTTAKIDRIILPGKSYC